MTSSIKITLTNPDTVAFYNEYYTPEETDTNIRAIIDTHVTNLRKHIRASNDRLEDKEIMLHMHKLEQNMYENHASQLLNISTTIASSINASTDESKSFIADEFKLLSQNIDALNSTIQSQILSLINTVDTAVTNSLEKLDVNVFSETIGKTIQDHLSLEISRLVQGQITVEMSISSLESKLRQELIIAQQPVQSRHDHIMSLLQTIPSHVSSICTSTSLQNSTETQKALVPLISSLDKKIQQLELGHKTTEIKAQNEISTLSRLLLTMSKDVHRMWKDIIKNSDTQKSAMTTAISHTPTLIQNMISTLATSLEKQTTLSKMTRESIATIQTTSQDNHYAMTTITSAVAMTHAKLEEIQKQLTRQITSQTVKGKNGEDRLYTILCERLTSREDYTVTMVSGQAHSCDINIKRINYPDIRIESKAIGELTNEKVRTRDVEKFRNDLLSTNSHGIFVSLYSGIVGKGIFGIEQMPNGKLAVYLSNNNYDIDTLHDMIILLYHLDKHTYDNQGELERDLIRISPDTMLKCSAHLNGIGQKIANAKTHLKETMNLLNEIAIEKIEQLLIGTVSERSTCAKNVVKI